MASTGRITRQNAGDYWYAVVYMYGLNKMRVNLDLAAKYAKDAANSGHVYAHSLYAQCLWHGYGATADRDEDQG